MIKLITLFISGFILFGQVQDDTIPWKKNYKLKWSDFKGSPQAGNDFAALTSYSLTYSMMQSGKGLVTKVDCEFDKKKSWGRIKNDSILAHEQLHFDIAELFARKIRKSFAEYVFNKKTFQRDLKAIYLDAVQACSMYQQQYDSESEHSINRKGQRKWDMKIRQEMEALSAYAKD